MEPLMTVSKAQVEKWLATLRTLRDLTNDLPTVDGALAAQNAVVAAMDEIIDDIEDKAAKTFNPEAASL